jgi:uncharacterized protein (UPF0262 family)
MKFSGFQKYFLLLMLSLGIAQGGHAYFSSADLDFSDKSTNVHSNDSQTLHSNFLFDLIEENIKEDSEDTHYSLDFSIVSCQSFTFQKLYHETCVSQNFLSSQPFYNQKINILNCVFLI